ncbi:hypothetical protein GYMLUDRAFT_86733 [Collybiopsis luxurians FD-317 M1]|uniref:F-box domain-containing protein n=1 Tax=Collybiopsis luxurians FD-317 M1 TaxID=944289 RepID=A0A0D0BQT6_9AGAR|nr:hypothetical protein GYMLUDRAFT_86733 [Collybiopsis luxurians FD-317 M1]
MHNRPKDHLNNLLLSQTSSSSQQSSTQHGLLSSIPAENLTHITAYLDPDSLFTLSLVSRALYEHVTEDHTWHRAFLLSFLGIAPESDVDSEKALVLRRTESTWRKEYVLRYNLTRRWERTRNTTIAHAPVYSPISRMHLMLSNSLLCSSLQYGIVSRSIPLHGKVIKGFLSPSSAGTGLGIGNPNTEFSPNVTACAMTSEGGTAKIVWGFRNGEIAVMTAARTMETNTRSAARLVRCRVDEVHEGEVTQVEWDDSGTYIVSASKDGRIKVWDAKKVRCVWTSQYLFPAITVSVALCNSVRGLTVVTTTEGGEIWIWAQIALTLEDAVVTHPVVGVPSVRVPYPIALGDQNSNQGVNDSHPPTSLHVDCTSSVNGIHVFVTYASRCEFWGTFFEYNSSAYQVSKYCSDETVGEVTALLPCLSADSTDECAFVIAGHQLGWVTVFSFADSSAPATNSANVIPLITPTRKFEAHPDGSAVTSLAWNDVVFVTGSDRGETSIFDACTFRRLRVLSSPLSPSRIRGIGVGAQGQVVSKNVTQIILGKDRDFLVACVGDCVMAFKADSVPKNGGKHKTSGKKKAASVTAKGYKRLLLDQLIDECLDEHDKETKHIRSVYKREREHRENLDRLGLDEVEAVEYALMLSRDEALERARADEYASYEQAGPASATDDGVFEGDFDDIPASATSSSEVAPSIRVSSKASFSSLHSTGTPPTPKSKSRPIETRTSPSSSNQKIQVSPRSRREPLEAGFGDETVPISVSSSSYSSLASSTSHTPEHVFPIMNTNATPPRGSHSHSGSSSCSTSSSGGSPKKTAQGAWAKPLRSSSEGANGMKSNAAFAPLIASSAAVGRSSTARSRYGDDDMDEDLRLAIELSLKSAEDEARRRGDFSLEFIAQGSG